MLYVVLTMPTLNKAYLFIYLFIISYNMVKRLVITKDKLSTVLKMCHNSSGHQGVNKTINKINECYYWKGIVENTRKFVKQCEICQRQNKKAKTAVPELNYVSIDQRQNTRTNFTYHRWNKFSNEIYSRN